MTLWTKDGSEPVSVEHLPFRLERLTGDEAGHTVTEIWNWPQDEQAQILAECGYEVGPEKPAPMFGYVVYWTGSKWSQKIDIDGVLGGATLSAGVTL